MKLINGPYNGRVIDDMGTVTQKMAIRRPLNGRAVPHAGRRLECGYAVYEPLADRSLSFWRENVWDGILIEEGRL